MIGFPILISIIQVLLLLFVFPYDSPEILLEKKQENILNELFRRIYGEE